MVILPYHQIPKGLDKHAGAFCRPFGVFSYWCDWVLFLSLNGVLRTWLAHKNYKTQKLDRCVTRQQKKKGTRKIAGMQSGSRCSGVCVCVRNDFRPEGMTAERCSRRCISLTPHWAQIRSTKWEEFGEEQRGFAQNLCVCVCTCVCRSSCAPVCVCQRLNDWVQQQLWQTAWSRIHRHLTHTRAHTRFSRSCSCSKYSRSSSEAVQ